MRIIPYRKFWLIFSLAAFIIAIPLIFIFKIPLGMDFTGGTLVEIKPKDKIEISNLREKVGKFYSQEALIQDSGDNQYIIRTKITENQDYRQFEDELKKSLPEVNILRHNSIGSSVGKDLTRKAIIGVAIAAILIIFYIAYAFRSVPRTVSAWSFGTVAIITLFHDLVASLAIYFIVGKIAGYELDSMVVVAVLTILGFSTHDTIVVFDRIRENVIKNPQKSFPENVNSSINQTIARSLNTSLTAILVLISMLILGGSTIKPFIFLLTIGIALGTYSSIFVASPLLVTWFETQNKKKSEG
ncbi:MAG: protein translocase subunit SecF [Candidatus Berkelbacteria bacterium]|nr:protein translocase subunit SecF [Candidatus Berkelbacteria bacterium]